MVRVLSRVPFNLRNDSTNGISNASSSRSERSPSANLTYPQDHGAEYFSEQGISRLSSRSASASSIHHASTSRLSDEIVDGTMEHKLKVQLIPSTKSKMRILGRRGRSSTRYGHLGDETNGLFPGPPLEGIQSVDSNCEDIHSTPNANQVQPEANGTAGASEDVTHPETMHLTSREHVEVSYRYRVLIEY